MNIKIELLLWLINFLKKRLHLVLLRVKLCRTNNFEKRKVRSSFIDRFRFLLCFIGIYSKHTWLIPLKDKKVLQLLMLFRKS